MRVTSFVVYEQFKRSLQRNLSELSEHNNRLSTGKKISKPSDDIVGMMRSMDYKISINNIEQYKRNITEAINHLEFAEQIISSVNDSLIRAKELAISGASNALNAQDRLAIAKEISQIRDHIINLSNTRFKGNYIFSGFKTDVQPFDPSTFNYNGDDGAVNIYIDTNVSIQMNIPGSSSFTIGGVSFARILDDLRIALENNNSAEIRASIDRIDNAINQTINTSTEIGARLNRLDDQTNRLQDDVVSFKSLLSNIEDTDIAEVTSGIAKAQTALEALRASSARVMSQSLFDFLR